MTWSLGSFALGALAAYGVPAGIVGWLVFADAVTQWRDRRRAAPAQLVPFHDDERHRQNLAMSDRAREILAQDRKRAWG